jgi:hypothetical protein
MAESVRVEGARELSASARHAADELADMSKAHGQAGDYVAQLARGMAPARSGRLRSTIRAERAEALASVTAGGAGVPYAGPIHFGWAARNIAAQPFLTDALAQAESSVVNIYGDEVDHIVARIHGK